MALAPDQTLKNLFTSNTSSEQNKSVFGGTTSGVNNLFNSAGNKSTQSAQGGIGTQQTSNLSFNPQNQGAGSVFGSNSNQGSSNMLFINNQSGGNAQQVNIFNKNAQNQQPGNQQSIFNSSQTANTGPTFQTNPNTTLQPPNLQQNQQPPNANTNTQPMLFTQQPNQQPGQQPGQQSGQQSVFPIQQPSNQQQQQQGSTQPLNVFSNSTNSIFGGQEQKKQTSQTQLPNLTNNPSFGQASKLVSNSQTNQPKIDQPKQVQGAGTTNLFSSNNNNSISLGGSNTAANQGNQANDASKTPLFTQNKNPSQQIFNSQSNQNKQSDSVPHFGNSKPQQAQQGQQASGQPLMNPGNKGMQQTKNVGQPAQGNAQNTQKKETQPQPNEAHQKVLIDYEKPHQTVGEYIDEWRKILLQSYKQLTSQCETMKSYYNDRKENQKIINNFKQLDPVVTQNKQRTEMILQSIQRRQNQMSSILAQIKDDLGYDINQRYPRQHPLYTQIHSLRSLRKEVNAEDQKYSGEKDEDPSNQQLKNIFCNLDSVENEIRRINHVLNHYFAKVSN